MHRPVGRLNGDARRGIDRVHLCLVSSKVCWQDEAGGWVSSGGFPTQTAALAALFGELTLVIVQGAPREGGIALPRHAHVVPLRSPVGNDTRRKISVVANLRYYLQRIERAVRNADVVYAPVPSDISLLGMLVAGALRKRLLSIYMGSWATNSQTTWMNRVTRALMRKWAGGNNVMFALGPVGLTTVPAPRMHWLFDTTVSRNELRGMQPALARGPHVPLRLTYVGRLSPEKGLPHLLEAIGLLRADDALNGAMPQLTLVGDGPQRAELLERVKRLGCEANVRFAGQLDRAGVVRELLRADMCVIPSLSEGFGKARLDAMACGVPVLTTDVGFGREIVGSDGDRGWVVPPGDARALAAVLRRVVTEPVDWPNMRSRCRRYVEGQTLEVWAARIGDICARQWDLPMVGERPEA